MALTVRETKAGSRPAGGYASNTPTKASHPLGSAEGLVYHRPVLKPGPSQAGRDGRRVSTARPVIGPLGLRKRNIL